MKKCPICNETYSDENLNFCLNDGGTLQAAYDEPPPTVVMNSPRSTNPNFSEFNQFGKADREIYQPPFAQPAVMTGSQDQTLPIISLVLGILGLVTICCYGGIPFGIGAIVTGFLGMKNADSNPHRYGGKGMAIAGLILGAAGLLIGVGIIFLYILGSLA